MDMGSPSPCRLPERWGVEGEVASGSVLAQWSHHFRRRIAADRPTTYRFPLAHTRRGHNGRSTKEPMTVARRVQTLVPSQSAAIRQREQREGPTLHRTQIGRAHV